MGKKVNRRIKILEKQVDAILRENNELKQKLIAESEYSKLITQIKNDNNSGFFWAIIKALYLNKAFGYLGAAMWIFSEFFIPFFLIESSSIINGLKGISLPFVFSAAIFEVLHNLFGVFGEEPPPLTENNKVRGYLWLSVIIFLSILAYYYSINFITEFLINQHSLS